ncbi:hypothetical protein BB560_005753, partial [Smittium megazygosporum]
MIGAQLIAQALKAQNVSVVFGIVGIPVVEIGEALIASGIKFIAFRNEQAASYAASAWGYITGTPGVCLVVSGPGIVNALSGIVNAKANRWPLVVIGGSCETSLELDQVDFCKPHTKFSAKPNSPQHIPSLIQRGFSIATNGVPGAVYLDFPADYITCDLTSHVQKPLSSWYLNPTTANNESIHDAAITLLDAKSPLVIIGKGAAYSRAENDICELVDLLNIPFLPTPMGKGVVPDSHKLNVSAA